MQLDIIILYQILSLSLLPILVLTIPSRTQAGDKVRLSENVHLETFLMINGCCVGQQRVILSFHF